MSKNTQKPPKRKILILASRVQKVLKTKSAYKKNVFHSQISLKKKKVFRNLNFFTSHYYNI